MTNIRILTYNILAEVFVKKQYYPNTSSNLLNYQNRREHTLRVIENSSIDFIMLQEAQDQDRLQFEKYLSSKYECSTLAAKSEIITARSAGTMSLVSKTWTGKYDILPVSFDNGKKCQVINCETPDGKRFSIVNIHLDFNVKEKQFAMLEELVFRRFLGPFIIVGDMNATRKEMEKMFEKHATLKFINAINGDPDTYFSEDGKGTRQCDHIWIEEGYFQVKSINISNKITDLEECLKQFGSDHAPVEVVINIV
ncbi:unnamed protein product [Adineta ricciae]|uniref:Endonuclease/exonuclease/phosphatase domain-containing protein n=1 Tax=Adineta ricciae TaxID=249248 RepID=A0A815Z5K5_ADIRI|nr:unnamed protein product [Adineta ricciae]CAF1580495.1 unnamed protein product [Adineta ricciae]